MVAGVLDAHQVAVDLGQERAAAARQQVVHVRVLDRVAGDQDGRPARQVDERAQHARVGAQLHVVVLVVAGVVGRRWCRRSAGERPVRGRLGVDLLADRLLRRESSVNGMNTTSIVSGSSPSSSHSLIQRVRTSSGFSPAKNSTRPFSTSRPASGMPCATCTAMQQRNRGLAAAGRAGERVDVAPLQQAVDQVVRRHEAGDELGAGLHQPRFRRHRLHRWRVGPARPSSARGRPRAILGGPRWRARTACPRRSSSDARSPTAWRCRPRRSRAISATTCRTPLRPPHPAAALVAWQTLTQ